MPVKERNVLVEMPRGDGRDDRRVCSLRLRVARRRCCQQRERRRGRAPGRRAARRRTHRRTLLAIAFGAEELGLAGARFFVHDAKTRGELGRIKGVVNLECLARGERLELWAAPDDLRERGLRIAARLDLGDLPTRQPIAESTTFRSRTKRSRRRASSAGRTASITSRRTPRPSRTKRSPPRWKWRRGSSKNCLLSRASVGKARRLSLSSQPPKPHEGLPSGRPSRPRHGPRRLYSSGEWLMPLLLGTKIIAAGTWRPTSIASWPAPLGSRLALAPSVRAARSTDRRARDRARVARARRSAPGRAQRLSSAATRVTVSSTTRSSSVNPPAVAARTSIVKSATPGTTFAPPGSTEIFPTLAVTPSRLRAWSRSARATPGRAGKRVATQMHRRRTGVVRLAAQPHTVTAQADDRGDDADLDVLGLEHRALLDVELEVRADVSNAGGRVDAVESKPAAAIASRSVTPSASTRSPKWPTPSPVKARAAEERSVEARSLLVHERDHPEGPFGLPNPPPAVAGRRGRRRSRRARRRSVRRPERCRGGSRPRRACPCRSPSGR